MELARGGCEMFLWNLGGDRGSVGQFDSLKDIGSLGRHLGDRLTGLASGKRYCWSWKDGLCVINMGFL